MPINLLLFPSFYKLKFQLSNFNVVSATSEEMKKKTTILLPTLCSSFFSPSHQRRILPSTINWEWLKYVQHSNEILGRIIIQLHDFSRDNGMNKLQFSISSDIILSLTDEIYSSLTYIVNFVSIASEIVTHNTYKVQQNNCAT